MAICIVCDGTKKLKVGLTDYQVPENSHTEEIDCFWCEGTGDMSNIQLRALEEYRNSHCSCMMPSNPYMCRKGVNPRTQRPNIHCSRCGKVILEEEVIKYG